MIRAYTGETIKATVAVVNEGTPTTPKDLSSAVAKLGFKNVETGTLLEKDCTIEDNLVVGRLESSETLTAGRYTLELRISIDGEVDSILVQTVILKDAVLKTISGGN